ncbi:MAG: hypothetical protein EXS32_05395 [Opitutus sp.]|nr:hypothetical protein [Opitutus sp.]
MKFTAWKLLGWLLVLPWAAAAANPALAGRWRLDLKRSTALDGWTAWDLVVVLDGPRVELRHEMQWRSTKATATNTVDTGQPTTVQDFFRVEQRHLALYAVPGAATPVRAEWLDGGRTLRVEATVPVESSQGTSPMRVYQEWRLIEGDRELALIELHSTRGKPLVYRFTKITGEK